MSKREEILNTNDEKNSKLFTELISGEKRTHLTKYDPMTGHLNDYPASLFWEPEYRETDYFGILFTSKGGSSWIRRNISKHGLERLEHPQYIPAWRYAISPDKKDSKKTQNENSGEFRNILNSSSEKDLIVVTRNPSKKFISGLWEEINRASQDPFIKGFLISKGINFSNDTNLLSLDDNEIENIIHAWILGTYNLEGTLSFAHCRLHNEGYYHLLSSNNINKKKLKIVNIDSKGGNLANLFSDYWPHLKNEYFEKEHFSSHRPKHERLLSILLKICRKDHQTHRHIIDIITRDLYYFNKINSEFKEQLYGL